MNKTELAKVVAEKTEIAKGKAVEVVNAVFDTILETLASGESVDIAKVARFEVVETEARVGRNPSTGETVQVPAGRKVKVKKLSGLKI